jgi:hypothetical protein
MYCKVICRNVQFLDNFMELMYDLMHACEPTQKDYSRSPLLVRT